MIWIEFLCAFALALFVAGLRNSDDREGWVVMTGAIIIVAGLLRVFGAKLFLGLL